MSDSSPHSRDDRERLLAETREAGDWAYHIELLEEKYADLEEQLEAARKEAREWRLTAETNGDNWHRLNEQFETQKSMANGYRIRAHAAEEQLEAADAALRWVADNYPKAMREMPTPLFRALTSNPASEPEAS